MKKQVKKRKPRVWLIIVIVLALVALAAAGFFAYRYFTGAPVKNFVGSSIENAQSWARENEISVQTNSVFNKEYDENIIVLQSVPEGKRLNKRAEITFDISKGPDPGEPIPLPDFSNMSGSEISDWIKREKAVNARLISEFNDTIAAGRLIKVDCGVSEENYTRGDTLSIHMSKGKEYFTPDIPVPDFAGKAKSEAQAFADKHSLSVTFEETPSDTVAIGCVISQSAAVGGKIAKNSNISFVISLGKSVTVPNFSGMNEAAAAAITSVDVSIGLEYHDTIAQGQLISQSRPAGEVIIGETAPVTVIYSLGRPYLENIVGKTEKEIETIFNVYKACGASITHSFQYVDSPLPKGTATGASKLNTYLALNEHVEIFVSKGNEGQ